MWCMVDPYRVQGALDLDALEAAGRDLLIRHKGLAVGFYRREGEWEQVPGDSEDFALEVYDLTAVPISERELAAAREIAQITRRPFEPWRHPQLTIAVLRLDPTEYVVATAVDHIVFDVVSGVVLFQDLCELYRAHARGSEIVHQTSIGQYPEFAAWQRDHFRGEVLEGHLQRVTRRLGGHDPVLPYRFSFARTEPPPEELRWNVGYETIAFAKQTQLAIDDLSRTMHTSRFPVHLAALLIALSLDTGEADVWIRTPVANRIRPGTERSIGWYANAVVVGARVSDADRFSDVLQRVWANFLAMLEDQQLPFDLLLKYAQPDAYPQWSEIPAVALTFHDRMLDVEPELDGLHVRFDEEMFDEIDDYPVTTAILALRLEDMENLLRMSARYRLDLYTEAGVAAFLAHYREILTRVTRDPQIAVSALRRRPAAAEEP
jgi:hypothetical protein